MAKHRKAKKKAASRKSERKLRRGGAHRSRKSAMSFGEPKRSRKRKATRKVARKSRRVSRRA